MSKAFKGNGALHHNRSVLEEPECAALIGGICGAWSNLETTLALLYTKLVIGHRHLADASDRALMESLDSVDSILGKRRLLLAAARATVPKRAERLDKVLKAIQDIHQVRNNIVHGRWATSDDYPGRLIWCRQVSYFADAKVYEAKDFAEIIDKIDNLVDDLRAFLDESLPELEAFAQRSAEVAARLQAERNGHDGPTH